MTHSTRFMRVERSRDGSLLPRHTLVNTSLSRPDFLAVFQAQPVRDALPEWERAGNLMPPGRWVPHRLADGSLIGLEAE